MMSARTRSALTILALALTLSAVTGASSEAKLRQFLKRSLIGLFGKQDLTRDTLAELLAELNQAENEVMQSDDLSRNAGYDDVRQELERAADTMLVPRERKAGCKNFFWKTFTSC